MESQGDYIYKSKLPQIDIPKNLPLHTYCFQHIDRFSGRPCLINGATGDIYTYEQVEQIARKVAAGLHKLGIKHHDVIMLLVPNSPEFAFAFLGASYLGAAVTTANPLFTSAEIKKQVNASNARLIITHSRYAEKALQCLVDTTAQVQVICTGNSAPRECLNFSMLIDSDEAEMPNIEISPENDVVALPFSSGTTGLPKGVMLTHSEMVASISQQVDGENPNLYLSYEDTMLCVLPLFHVYCMNFVLMCGLRVGAGIVIMERFEVKAMVELVEQYKVTVAPIVPPIVVAMAKSKEIEQFDLSSVRMVVSGGAPMRVELEDIVKTKFHNAKLGQGFGMTEVGPISMCLAFAKEPFQTKSGSCGTVVRNSLVKIVDPETGLSLPPNQVGEICIKGPHIMKGYLNDLDATKMTIDKDGWLHTGDIGYVDEDDEMFIVDRLKELIKYKGFQVAPSELEALLINHPNISDAAVVPMRDDLAGEVPVAFIVKSNGSNVTEEDIKHYISKQVVFYKRINRVFFIDSIPKAPSGKILRKILREGLNTVLVHK